MDCDGSDPLEKQIENFCTAIREIEEDIVVRVREADHNFISSLCKFISTYRKMQKSSQAPTSTIAYAFHIFGRPDSKSLIVEHPVLVLHFYFKEKRMVHRDQRRRN